ncbi:Cuticle protein 7 [Amphibalanus amphitrite]|uniref:Cuticle protein 7 n=1 Tax=Amphibalanus amphitrite TaxID=1232801 RepID=A0A6A4WGX5_AMPAM|nr:Cuticle protein 7 [Amphibalanus amphitrite]
MRRHHLATLVVTLALMLTPPVSGRPQDDDVVVLEALPFALPPSPLEAPAAGTTLGATVQDPEGPRLRSSQGPEGFAYESSHPVLDAYGALTTATQYHAQDGLGRYRYSYRQPGSTREEYVDENGRIQGSYSYEMPNEEKVSLTYYADDTGFHVKRAVLPNLAAQAPRDEPEVAAIKAAHMRLWRRMWARAAAASVGAPYDPLELEAEVSAAKKAEHIK